MRSSAARTLFLASLTIAALALPLSATAQPGGTATHAAAPNEPPEGHYKPVELASWVPPLRGQQRVIIQPTGVSFKATFDGGPRTQKTDYLQTALNMMHVSQPPKVNQAVRLRYGPAASDTLIAYIDDAAAERLRKEVRPGEKREFFAFHVYNFSKGPALVITSFGPGL